MTLLLWVELYDIPLCQTKKRKITKKHKQKKSIKRR